MVLEFRVLGPLEALRDGAPIDLGPPKQRALLISLLLHANRTVPLDRLTDELWPESSPKAAKAGLHAYVSRLRTALGDSDATVLRTRPGGYELAVDAGAIDSARFEHAGDQGRRLLTEGRAEKARMVFEEGLALWRGEPLADVADQTFALAEVVRLREVRLTVQEGAIEAMLAAGDHADAVATLGPLIDAHPLRERLLGQLVLALYRSGRQTEALDQFHAYRERLAEELGMDPGPTLQRLAESVLRHDAALQAPTPGGVRAGGSPGDVLAPSPPGGHRGAAPLVGRSHELSCLTAAFDEVVDGRGGMVLLAGDAGIGKTRLLDELSLLAARVGVCVFWGRTHEGGGAPAFWPWTQIVRDACERFPEVLADLTDEDIASLAQLAPDLARGRDLSTVVRRTEPEAERFTLFAAVGQLLGRLSARFPVVVLLEDLHWADGPSLELLSLLHRQTASSALLVVATHRDAPGERSHELDTLLASLARQGPVRHLTLTPLDRDQVATVLSEMLGNARAPAVAGIVHDRTDGNPFFVTEFARLLETEGIHPVTAAAVPTGVNHVLQRRVRSLPETTQRLLTTAAVVGRTFDLRTVADALDLELDHVLNDVAPALEHRLVEETDEGLTALCFVHALVRETLLDGLPGLAAAQLHRAIGDAIIARGASDDELDELAEHVWQAGELGDPDDAVRVTLAAAQVNEDRTAYEQAEHHLRRALVLANRLIDGREVQLQVMSRLAELLVRTQGFSAPGLVELIEQAPAPPPGEATDVRLLQLWQFLWSHHHSGGQLDAAIEVAEQLLAESQRHDDAALLALAHFCAGASTAHRGNDAEALRHFRTAGEQLTDDLERYDVTASHLAVDIPMYRALTHAMSGDAAAARRFSVEAVAQADRVGRPFSRALATVLGEAWVHALVEDPASTQSRAAAAADLSTEHGFHQLAAIAELLRHWAMIRLDAPEGQVEAMTASLAELQRSGSHIGETFWLALLADAHVWVGDLAAAHDARRRAHDVAQSRGEHGFAPWLHRLDQRLARGGRATGDIALRVEH